MNAAMSMTEEQVDLPTETTQHSIPIPGADVVRFAIVSLLLIHGLIHAMGFAGAWNLAEFQGASKTPTTLVSLEPGGGTVKALGLIWLVALAAFLLAAALLMGDSVTWRSVALGAAAIRWSRSPYGGGTRRWERLRTGLVVAAVLLAPRLEGVAS